MSDIERIINEINGSMTIEGMPLTEKDKECIRLCLNGTLSFDEAIASVISEYIADSSD